MTETVKVRIAVAVDPRGKFNACAVHDDDPDGSEAMGWAVDPLDPGEARYFVTAELAVPEPVEVEGKVEPA